MKSNVLFVMALVVLFFASCGPRKLSEHEQEMVNAVRQDSLNKVAAADSIVRMKQEVANDSIEGLHIKGYSVKLVSKVEFSALRIEVEYHSLIELLNESAASAKTKMWTADQIRTDVDYYLGLCRGGRIEVRTYDQSLDLADIGNVTVIVKDTADKEIYRNAFSKETPSVIGDEFSGLGLANMPHKMPDHFFVYVMVSYGKTPYKYEVKPIAK